MKRHRLPLAASAIFALTALALPAKDTSPARFVPLDAAVYVELSDTSRVIDRLLAPDITNLLDAVPQFRQFKESDQYRQLQQLVEHIEKKLETDWRKGLTDLTAGGVAFAIRQGNPDYVLLIMKSKDASLLKRANDLLIEIAENDAKDKGQSSPVKKKDYKGVTAYSIGNDEFHAIVGDTLVASNKGDGLKAALEMNVGEGPAPITDLAHWKEARSRLPKGAVGWSFARLDVFRDAGFTKDLYAEKAQNAVIPLIFGGLPRVLREAPYASASLVIDDQRLALRAEVPRGANLKPWPESLRGFYATKPGEEAAVPLRPRGTLASLSFYRDFKSIWDMRDQLVTAEGLLGLNNIETEAAPILFGNREFSTEVLGEIGPRVRLVAATQDYRRAGTNPDLKIPAFALVLELKHPEEFATDLTVGYQSVTGIVNIGFGQQRQPRFLLTTEQYKSHRIDFARFIDRVAAKSSEPTAHLRHNFTPACSTAGRYFVLGSTVEIVRDVIDSLGDVNAPPQTTEHNILFETDATAALAALNQNRDALISQNMVSNGNTRAQAEQEFDLIARLVGLFSKGQITWTADDRSLSAEVAVEFATAK